MKILGADWSTGDILASIFTGGIYAAYKGIKDSQDGGAPTPTPVTPQDYTKSAAYQAAQKNLSAAQARQQQAQSQQASITPAYQVTVPSFALPSVVGHEGEIMGKELCGFHGYRGGYDPSGFEVLGATKSRSAPRHSGRPVKRARGAATAGKSPHKLALATATQVVKATLAAGSHALARAKQYKPAQHQPLVPMKAVTVSGILGVAPTRPLTPHQTQMVQRHVNAIRRHAAAAVWAKKQGDKAVAAAHTLDQTRGRAAPVIAKLLARPTGRSILGQRDVYAPMVGVDANGLSPGDPGYDPSTDADAAAQQGADSTASGPVSNYDPSQDPNILNLGPIPPTRDQPLSQSDAQNVWHKVPDDGVVYQGDRGFPDQGFGSFNHFYGPPGATDGYEWHGTGDGGGWWMHRGDNFDRGNPGPPLFGADIWGPLIGNPQGPLAGLQYAVDDKKWFWQSANAPSWATVDQDNALAETAAKIAAADKAAADADAARVAQEQAQIDEAQAKQDAANALAQSAADTQTQIQQQKQASQQADLDIQQQQQEQAQAAKDAEQDAQARAIQLDYLRSHPELLEQEDDGGGDFGDGAMNDAIPGPSDYPGGASGEGGADFGPSPNDPLANVPYAWEEGQ